MKKILIATVATAALAFAAPASAQILGGATGDVTGAVTGAPGQVTGAVTGNAGANVNTPNDNNALDEPRAQVQDRVGDTTDRVQGGAEAAAQPHAVTGSVSNATRAQAGPATAGGETAASAQVTTPDASGAVRAANTATDRAAQAADNAADAASSAANDTNASASANADASAMASASPNRIAASSRGAATGAVNVDLPSQVEQAMSDGSYTTDDLNRAQLAALQSPAGR